MKTVVHYIGLGALVSIISVAVALAVPQDIDWNAEPPIALKARPLDIAVSKNGDLVFILTRGSILVFSDLSENPIKRIPVDSALDRISFSEKTDVLLLTGNSAKVLQEISIQRIQPVKTAGSPYLGPADAPVVVTVFDDYQ